MTDDRIRLQKYLSMCAVASRRKSEELIAQGKVKINGKVAQIGDKVSPKRDTVTVSGKKVAAHKSKIYIMLHKPRGFITTMDDEMGRKCVAELVSDVGERVYPVGRLDKDSEGLLLLTNDGDLINAMMRGANHHEKEYVVKVDKKITPAFLSDMAKGVYLKELELTTRACEIREIGPYTFQMILTQGVNRQIRRMCQTLGYQVKSLKRIRVMSVSLGDLKPGEYRQLDEEDLEQLYKECKICKQD